MALSTSAFRPVPTELADVVAAQPGAIAIAEPGGRTVRYGELWAHAQGVADWLAARGAGAEVTVGVCLPRGAGLAVAELGIWLAGAAFVPLDPDAPPERLRAIARDAGLARILVDATTVDRVPGGPGAPEAVRVEAVAPAARATRPTGWPGPRDMAYVMYTSGSTGQPRGVVVEHAALANFVAWHRRSFALSSDSRTTLVYSPAFDSSVAELWPALTAGARIAVPDHDTRLIPARLLGWLVAEGITLTDLPSALVEQLLALPWPADAALRTLLSGGDRLQGRPAPGSRWQLFNQYGPTEATVTATSGLVEATGEGLPGIGRPIAGVTAYVLDEAQQPVPVGVEGELYLAGAGLARGYLGQPEATAARFVADPFAAARGARMYRTGDRVRRLADGSLAFCGRADDQIKLRGFRIEPAEIAAALRAHPAVTDAHVRLHAGALVAYVVPADARPDPSELDVELRAHLARRLPAYMVPSAYVALHALPVTANGKLDAAALPPPERPPVPPRQRPATELEHALARVWQRVLGAGEVGVEDSFFDLGGNSLLLAQVHHAIAAELGRELAMVTLFEHPTIRALARHLAGEAARGAPDGAELARPDAARAEARARLQGRRNRLGAGTEGR